MTPKFGFRRLALQWALLAGAFSGCGRNGDSPVSEPAMAGRSVVWRASWGGEFLRLPGDVSVATPARGLMSTEVTLAMWRWFEPTVERRRAPFSRNDAPMTQISYPRATEFARWASSQGDGWVYSIPTLDQWRQAVGAGWRETGLVTLATEDLTVFGNVDDQTAAAELDWPQGIGAPGRDGFVWVAPVASFRPNLAGFYDLLGNVWEWTADRTEVGGKPGHVVAGGGWHFIPASATPGATTSLQDETSTGTCGVRLLATPAGP
jgi:formylglycine-generating enzyme required for sulfatase activity